MRRRSLTAALLATALGGCGGQSVPPETKTPHDGTLVGLPQGRGFAEVLKQADPSAEGQVKVVIYFLNESRKPMEPPPTAASLKFQAAGARPLELQPGRDSSMATPTFADPGEVNGVLSATIDGKAITTPILVR